jgi:predicted SAM-dependent methyltransferase
MIFKDSELAHKYLDGLRGIEVGASYHNPFNLDTINIDIPLKPEYITEQLNISGKVAEVHLTINNVTELPFSDKSYDFVINSHVIEHIYRPDLAIKEWCRVAKNYIFLIIPHKDRTFDRDKELTKPEDIFSRDDLKEYPDTHYNIWDLESFLGFINHLSEDVEVIETQDPDDKVGNGFTVVLKIIEK